MFNYLKNKINILHIANEIKINSKNTRTNYFNNFSSNKLNFFSKMNFSYNFSKDENKIKKDSKKTKTVSLYPNDRVVVLPPFGDKKKMSPFEKRMLKKLDIKDLKKDSKIKLATIQKINRKDNTAVITNYKLKNKYIDLNILGYHFETGNLSIIKRHNESVPIELDRLKLFTKLEKDRNDNIVSFKEAKLVPRKNRSLRVDRATKMKFPIKRLSYEAVENLRKKKHETAKVASCRKSPHIV